MATASNENLQLNQMAPSANDATVTKRQCLQQDAAASRAIGRVLDVEMLLRGLLALLDLASLASFLEVLAVDESWREVLTNEELWKEMLATHFSGKLPAVEQFNDDEETEDDDDEENEVDEEDDEEEIREDVDDEEPDIIEILEGDMDVEDDVSFQGDDEDHENEDDDDVEIIDPPFRPRALISARQMPTRQENDAESEAVAGTTPDEKVTWIEGVPSQKVVDLACAELKEFLQSAEQLVQFDARVQIVRGDIGEITMVGEQRVDGLAFPTTPFLRNPHSGAAAVIFRRAGQGLNDHVRTLDVRLDVGQVHATPGFDAGVDKLIHCVGPSSFTSNCMRELQRTYRNVLRCIQQEKLSCVAMTSISTGNMGMPVDNAAWFALCAIQRFMRTTDWTATIGIVCFEADAYAAFTKSKAKLLTRFNADSIRAIPPLRNNR